MSQPSEPSEVTRWLESWRRGEDGAEEHLLPLVYQELRRLARRAMRGERRDHTLQPTALVHEAFLRLLDSRVDYLDRTHFFAVACRSMRRILLDHAKAGRREKRGGAAVRVELQERDAAIPGPDVDALALATALEALERRDEIQCRILELRFFGGLTYEEIAQALDMSRASVGRELRFGRAWLRAQLQREGR